MGKDVRSYLLRLLFRSWPCRSVRRIAVRYRMNVAFDLDQGVNVIRV